MFLVISNSAEIYFLDICITKTPAGGRKYKLGVLGAIRHCLGRLDLEACLAVSLDVFDVKARSAVNSGASVLQARSIVSTGVVDVEARSAVGLFVSTWRFGRPSA